MKKFVRVISYVLVALVAAGAGFFGAAWVRGNDSTGYSKLQELEDLIDYNLVELIISDRDVFAIRIHDHLFAGLSSRITCVVSDQLFALWLASRIATFQIVSRSTISTELHSRN